MQARVFLGGLTWAFTGLWIAAAPAAMLPNSIPGSVLWLDATQLPTQADDTDISLWTDHSSVGTNHGTANASGIKPRYIASGFNGLPVVRFNGASSYFDLPDLTGIVAGNYTVFAVYSLTTKALAGNENDRLLHIQTASQNAGLQINSDGLNQRMVIRTRRGNADVHGTGINGISFGSRLENSPEAFTFTMDTASSIVTRDGFTQSPGPATGSGLTTALISTIGRREDSNVTTFLNGDISEILIYDRALNGAERIVIENYLNAKYNLDNDGAPVFGNDHYSGDLSVNGNYDRDVVGIGSFGASAKLSTSSNGGLTLSEASNSLGADEWIFAGHRVATNSQGIDDDGNYRGERVWFLEKSATDGIDATLSFNLAEAGLTLPPAELGNVFYELLYSPSDPYSFVTLARADGLVGGNVSFTLTNAQLQSGFYTLGMAFSVPEPSSWLLLLGLGILASRRRQ